MTGLWTSSNCSDWSAALAGYADCVARQPSDLLQKRDLWYRETLPGLIEGRAEPYLTRDELLWIVEWKMARGVWRARNLHLARSNGPEEVEAASRASFAALADDRAVLKPLSALKGVGPATTSAALAACRPDRFPFFDDVIAEQIPGLVPGEFTVKAYLAYAAALRDRAAKLAVACPEPSWNAQKVGLALWSAAGGKLGPVLR